MISPQIAYHHQRHLRKIVGVALQQEVFRILSSYASSPSPTEPGRCRKATRRSQQTPQRMNHHFLLPLMICLMLSPASASAQQAPPNPNWQALQTVPRGTPPSDAHPENVFLLGETVTINVPNHTIRGWQLTDETERQIAQGDCAGADRFELGKLPVGWYRIGLCDSDNKEREWTTAAVPRTPRRSHTPRLTHLRRLRYRLVRQGRSRRTREPRPTGRPGRRQLDPRPHPLARHPTDRRPVRHRQHTTYDTSARIQNRYGLKVLQVFHDTPPWAAGQNSRGRFPTDLRHVYRFAKAMSQRFRGTVQAWEPWNESNVATFGGHTMDEICSYQKAAWLGFKAGDPNVTVCWNATTAKPTERQTDAPTPSSSTKPGATSTPTISTLTTGPTTTNDSGRPPAEPPAANRSGSPRAIAA